MDRELCLILDYEGYHRLILKRGKDYEIDEYTTKFENSTELREKHKQEINEFLNKYKSLLEKNSKKEYKGILAVVDPNQIGTKIENYQKQVIYKKHIIAFRQFIEKKDMMIKFSKYERSKKDCLITEQFQFMVRQPWTRKNKIKTFIKEWIKKEKDKKINYYNIIRDMMAVYKKECELYKLRTIDEIYEQYLKDKELAKRIKKRGNMKLQKENHTILPETIKYEEQEKTYKINGSTYNADEVTLFDIEQIDEETTDLLPDGLKRK